MRDDDVVEKAGDGLARVFPVDLGASMLTAHSVGEHRDTCGCVCASLCVENERHVRRNSSVGRFLKLKCYKKSYLPTTLHLLVSYKSSF